MNALKTVFAVAFALTAGAALAQEASSNDWMAASASAKSRTQVLAELKQARASGEMKRFTAGYTPSVTTSRDRAEIVAELERSRATGEFDRLNAEAVSFEPAGARAGSMVAAR